jgi:NAD/NADP transhydrogenase alpha subunit
MQSILDFFSLHMEIIYIVILSVFLGIEVIGRVPSVLHTPLMSGANAIHGVVVIGAIIVMGQAQPGKLCCTHLRVPGGPTWNTQCRRWFRGDRSYARDV